MDNNEYCLIREVAFHGAVLTVLGLCIIALGGRAAWNRIHLLPTTRMEWVAYWFHTLEVLMVSTTYSIAVYGRAGSYPAFKILPWLALCSTLLLMVSSIAFWRTERVFAKVGLVWVCSTILAAFLWACFIGVRYVSY